MHDPRASRERSVRARRGRLLLAGGLCLAVAALPVAVSSELGLGWQTALARGGPGGAGGPGGGAGAGGPGGPGGAGGDHGAGRGVGPGDEDRGPAAQGLGRGRPAGAGPPDHAGPGGYNSFGEFVDEMRSGRAFGLEQRDARVERARGRYQAALGAAAPLDEPGRVAHRFAPREVRGLIERGWTPARTYDDGFRNHGERVSTMVELSKQLGYGAHVGALQANFGTPQENGITDLEADLAAARADLEDDPENAELQAEVERLEADLEAAIAEAKPGIGPTDGWETADLDVNDDGVVDRSDLDALDDTASGD